jgi:hypothetical protein
VNNQTCIDQNNGDPAICPEPGQACVPLLTDECLRVIGDVSDDETLIVGGIHQLAGDLAIVGEQIAKYYTIAVEHISSGGNVPSPTRKRPVAVVMCHEGHDETLPEAPILRASAKHLIEDIGVPYLIGPIGTTYGAVIATDYAIPNNVMMWTDPDETTLGLDDKRLVWHAAEPTSGEGTVLGLALPAFEAETRTRNGLSPSDMLKVAVVYPQVTENELKKSAFTDVAEFNGQTAIRNFPDYYIEVNYTNAENCGPNFECFDDAVAQLLSFEPHILYVLSGLEGHQFVEILDAQLQAATAPEPVYVFSVSAAPFNTAIYAANDSLRQRAFGMRSQSVIQDRPEWDKFAVAYSARFNGEMAEPGFAIIYDLLYMFAYGTVGAGKPVKPTGAQLSSAFDLLVPPGPTIVAGPDDMAEGFGFLSNDANIDFKGVLCDCDFDLATQTLPPADRVAFCLTLDNESKVVQQDYVTVDSKTGDLGTVTPCPP